MNETGTKFGGLGNQTLHKGTRNVRSFDPMHPTGQPYLNEGTNTVGPAMKCYP